MRAVAGHRQPVAAGRGSGGPGVAVAGVPRRGGVAHAAVRTAPVDAGFRGDALGAWSVVERYA